MDKKSKLKGGGNTFGRRRITPIVVPNAQPVNTSARVDNAVSIDVFEREYRELSDEEELLERRLNNQRLRAHDRERILNRLNRVRENLNHLEELIDNSQEVFAAGFNPIKYAKDKYNKTKQFLVSGSKNFTTKVQNILKQVGNTLIQSITVCRTPVNSMVTQALKIASFNQLPYEKLFHLFIIINGNILLEKNSVINMDIIKGIESGTEHMNSPIPQNTTIIEFIERGLQRVGNDKFFTYSSYDNNCQYFILNLLQANGINDDNLNNFIKQNTESIFATNPALRKFTNNVTDLDGRAREIMGGTLLQKQCINQLNIDQLLSLIDASGQVKPFGLHPESNELILERIRQLTQPTSAPRVVSRKRK